MAGLLLKDIPPALHERLRVRAAAYRRSLSAEILTILEGVLDDRAGSASLEAIDALRVHGRRPLTQELLDAARHEGRR